MKSKNLFTALALMLSSLILTSSCSGDKPKADEKIHYVNLDCRVVGFGSDMTRGKNAHYYKVVLIQSLRDTSMFMEFSQTHYEPSLTDAEYYNWKIGDTIHFDFIKKERFFKMDKFTHM